MDGYKRSTGFTIVELLIVVVIIAILATITVIGYLGIQERAQRSAIAAQLKQVNTAILRYQALNNDALPASLSDITPAIPSSSTYTYWPYNSNKDYCLSMTDAKGMSYFTTSQAGAQPLQGRCNEINWVAGTPLGYIDTLGQTATLSTPLTGTPDLTLYVVISFVNANTGYVRYAGLSGSGASNLRFQGSTDGSTTAGYRLDTSATSNATGSQSNVRVAGLHIGWIQIKNNATSRAFAFDKANSNSSASFDPGVGLDFTELDLSPTTTNYAPIATTVYGAAHDEATRTSVMNWLAKKYNTGQVF